MQAVGTFLLALTCLSTCQGWTCKEGPQQFPASQIDAGRGTVVMTDKNSNVFFLSESTWHPLGSVPMKHVTVGAAGIWGVDSSNEVYKYVSNDFIPVNGLSSPQIDAGGEGHLIAVTSSDTVYCLKSDIATSIKEDNVVTWTKLTPMLKHVSCSPAGCWGVTSDNKIYYSTVTSTTCAASSWKLIDGTASMIEVGTDGTIFMINPYGHVYQRTYFNIYYPQGRYWTNISTCLKIKHLTYDLGVLWLVTEGGILLQCTP